jgi:serine O-acetyltransferase
MRDRALVQRSKGLEAVDPVWSRIREEAEEIARSEPALASFVATCVLHHETLEEAVVYRLAERLDHPDVRAALIRQAYAEALEDDAELAVAFRADIAAVADRDPACSRYVEPLLYFKGFHAIQTHRLAHWLWHAGRTDFALYLQSRGSSVLGVDIHPAAKLGRGLFIDHATGVVIGQTARVGDDVSLMQGVTLGGTGKERGDRHPKIGRGVLVGAGAKVLGNIEVGSCSRIAAGSVVLKPVPSEVTVAGVPARVIGKAGCSEPARTMDHRLDDATG